MRRKEVTSEALGGVYIYIHVYYLVYIYIFNTFYIYNETQGGTRILFGIHIYI